jgi:hypothetical protein
MLSPLKYVIRGIPYKYTCTFYVIMNIIYCLLTMYSDLHFDIFMI